MFINYLVFPQINPIAFSLGPISVHWYGLMYFFGFIFSMYVLLSRNGITIRPTMKKDELKYLLYMTFLGLLIGGRVGYILFYHPLTFYEDIISVFKIWQGGMSFHGGLIGVIVVWIFFSYSRSYSFFQISDFIAPVVPFGLAVGRLGNFINGELYGRVTTYVPWGMFFPNAKEQDIIDLFNHPEWQDLYNDYGALPRHPSQLYEMLLEGIFLFIIINFVVRRPTPVGSVSGLFLFFYGTFRIFIEFFREPDIHIGLFFGWISMGQFLSIPMVIAGITIMIISFDRIFFRNFFKNRLK